jgi:glycosyltransferase involved in cell wall biosynthesis
MTEGRKVTVVVPVFNRAGLIKNTLDSIQKQTYRPLEVVIVDDGSTDNTAEVIRNWVIQNQQDALRVRCVEQQNQGANSARNRGISEATGEFIAFLDSDDQWLAEKVEKQLAVFLANREIGGVYCGLQSVDLTSGKSHAATNRSYAVGDLSAAMLIRDVSSPTSCWMVRRNCFDDVGLFDISLPARQDWDMWIRLASKFKVGAVPEVLVEMGEHTGERVRSDPSREIAAHKTIFKKYAHLRKKLPFWVSLASLSAMYRRRGRVYLHRQGFRLKAISMQVLAIAVWPFCFDSYAALFGALLPPGIRSRIHVAWNRLFGKTALSIRSH